MKPGADAVRLVVELPARVEGAEHDLEGALALLVHLDRDAPAVVLHAAGAVDVEADLDELRVARHGLVDGVVDDLIDQVVEAADARVPDKHAGALADGLQAFEDLDRFRAVAPRGRRLLGHRR